MIQRAFLVACGALVAAACTVVESKEKEDSDGGAGGATASGGASSGGASSGGSGNGGAATGGSGSGGDASGGAPDDGGAGDSGADAAPDGSPAADAAPDATPGADASDGATNPFADGGACATDTGDDACSACIKSECCSEWLACDDDACAGDGASNEGELVRFQGCMIDAFLGDSGAASVNQCAGTAVGADGGTLSANTRTLVECLVAWTGTSNEQRCSRECFGGLASP